MKRPIISVLMALLVAFAAYVFVVNSAPLIPEGVQVFEVKDHTCVRAEGVLQCFCPCTVCNSYAERDETYTPTPDGTVTPFVTPEATKQKCNSGWGNSTENCNPGNSTQKPHDEGTPKKK